MYWNVAQVEPGKEIAYAKAIGGFVPQHVRRWISRGKRHEATLPQISSYVYIPGDLTDPEDWHRAAAISGYRRFLIGRVPISEIARVRSYLDENHIVLENPPEKSTRYAPGDTLIITNGSHTGLRITCLQHKGEKIKAEGYLLGGITTLYIRSSCCVLATEQDAQSSLDPAVASANRALPPRNRRNRKRHGRFSKVRGHASA